jgi:hypothetical protein
MTTSPNFLSRRGCVFLAVEAGLIALVFCAIVALKQGARS